MFYRCHKALQEEGALSEGCATQGQFLEKAVVSRVFKETVCVCTQRTT